MLGMARHPVAAIVFSLNLKGWFEHHVGDEWAHMGALKTNKNPVIEG